MRIIRRPYSYKASSLWVVQTLGNWAGPHQDYVVKLFSASHLLDQTRRTGPKLLPNLALPPYQNKHSWWNFTYAS
jgi:hypothetical protein